MNRRSQVVVLLSVAVCVLCGTSFQFTHAAGGGDVAPGAWQYEFLPDSLQPSFDLKFKLDFQTGAAPEFRLLLGQDEKEAAFIEASSRGISAGRIRAGAESRGQLLKAMPAVQLGGKTIVLERRSERWNLIADGRFLAGGELSGTVLKVGFGARGEGIAVSDLRYQPVPDIYFADTFMRTPEDPANWTELSGTWQVSVLNNPSLSANAFYYKASGAAAQAAGSEETAAAKAPAESTEAVAPAEQAASAAPQAPAIGASVVGEWFWSGLNFSAACKPAAAGATGLYLCYQGPDDYYLFRWTSADSQSPVRQFIRRRAGVDTVLAEAKGGYASGQWYQFGALVGCGWVQLSVDDTTFFSLRDDGLTYGKVGLYVEGNGEADFDDVLVESRRAESLDFGSNYLQQCLTAGGEWLPLASAAWDTEAWPGGVITASSAPSRLLWGQAGWRNYRLQAQLGAWDRGTMGLVFRYQDERNYYSARWIKGGNDAIQVWRRADGKDTLLAELPATTSEGPHHLAVSADNWSIAVHVDGRPALTTADYSLDCGRMGLYADGVNAGAFSRVMYDFLPGRTPVVNTHEAFAAEHSMSVWSGALSDWQKTQFTEGTKTPSDFWWRRMPFFGDARVDVRMDEPPQAGSEVGLVLNGDGETPPVPVASEAPGPGDAKAAVASPGKPHPGYLVRLSRPSKDRPFQVELFGDGQSLAQSDLEWREGPMSLSLMRTGNAIVVAAGGRPLLSHAESAQPAGRRIGWYARYAPIETKNIDIYSDTVLDYGFNTAPTDWRTGGGTWEVTNKWQCDPRWSFFSGRDKGLSVLWNKRPLRGDFTIEFFVGNKMDRERGNIYEYARDMDITVCADGKDLNSGYSFLFGGFNNSVTCAYRGAQRWALPAAGNELLINRAELHRKWYYVSISRTGSRIEMRIDDKLILSADDPDMLPGGHWGIWTYNNGLMIARVRVTAEEIGPRDAPDISWPLTTQQFYADTAN